MSNSAAGRYVESELALLPPFACLLVMPDVDYMSGDVGGQIRGSSRRVVADEAWRGLGPDDVHIVVGLDGFVIFEFDTSDHYAGGYVPEYEMIAGKPDPQEIVGAQDARTELMRRRIEYMNAFLQAVSSGASTVERIGCRPQTPLNAHNHFRAEIKSNHRWEIFGLSEPASKARTQLVLASKVFEHAAELLIACKRALGEDWASILSLIYIACHQYSLQQFSSSHLLSWCVVEKLLNKLWENMQSEVDLKNGGHTQINSVRRKMLGGREFSAAVVSQILSLSNRIDDRFLDWLNDARRTRNRFVHGLSAITEREASSAIHLSTDLLSRISDFKISGQVGYTRWA